jgi:hypothetical protein
MAQGVINAYKSHGVAYGPGINSAGSFLAYMNALKQNNPALYNQLMQDPTIRPFNILLKSTNDGCAV